MFETYAQFSITTISFLGNFWSQGRQTEKMMPLWVVQSFKEDPELKQIAANKKEQGFIYSRVE